MQPNACGKEFIIFFVEQEVTGVKKKIIIKKKAELLAESILLYYLFLKLLWETHFFHGGFAEGSRYIGVWMIIKDMKINNSKCQAVHLGVCNTRQLQTEMRD